MPKLEKELSIFVELIENRKLLVPIRVKTLLNDLCLAYFLLDSVDIIRFTHSQCALSVRRLDDIKVREVFSCYIQKHLHSFIDWLREKKNERIF